MVIKIFLTALWIMLVGFLGANFAERFFCGKTLTTIENIFSIIFYIGLLAGIFTMPAIIWTMVEIQ